MKYLKPHEIDSYVVSAYNKMDCERMGALPKENAEWNISGGSRIVKLYGEITHYVEERKISSIKILNLSGINEGKPDIVLFDLLAEKFGRDAISWSIVDHPLSETFSNPTIASWLDSRAIHRIPADFRDANFSLNVRDADIVLCTEIAEHLDYSVFICLLRHCRDALRPGGRLLITTPNAVFVLHRVLFALGQWDFLHHMDSPENVDHGILGHIMYYDKRRLSRILSDLSFVDIHAFTFNSGHGPGEFKNGFTRFAAISLRALSKLLPNSGQVLFLSAERAGAQDGESDERRPARTSGVGASSAGVATDLSTG
jgi:SAM-dependent methyltransferase